ncbi:hypothetical protein GGR52DRAFT_578810 [Hypoxylon sp. FL1284]|nr:hypothetical protein GGR52DRAFT_578810 [Hypoxylon sp. FL1284]
MPTTIKDDLVRLGGRACLVPLIGLFFCIKYTVDGLAEVAYAGYKLRQHVRVKTRRLPKSKPLAEVVPLAKSRTSTSEAAAKIRLQIYRLALGGPAIAQICTDSSFWGPRPDSWGPAQGIRDDADEPSAALRLIIGLGGSGLRQLVSPPSRGCVVHACVSQLICGDRHHFTPMWVYPEKVVMYTDLMRTCRVVYGDLLDVLYAHNTVSLFGSEIARYFCRNASPEGLSRVRFVHVALTIPSCGWDSWSQRKNIQGTIKMLQCSLRSLRQLDVEVVLTWGQPKDSQRFWTWLRKDVLAQLRGLERFVLKVTCLFPPPRTSGYLGWTPSCEPLKTWNDGEYRELKDTITPRGEQ